MDNDAKWSAMKELPGHTRIFLCFADTILIFCSPSSLLLFKVGDPPQGGGGGWVDPVEFRIFFGLLFVAKIFLFFGSPGGGGEAALHPSCGGFRPDRTPQVSKQTKKHAHAPQSCRLGGGLEHRLWVSFGAFTDSSDLLISRILPFFLN